MKGSFFLLSTFWLLCFSRKWVNKPFPICMTYHLWNTYILASIQSWTIPGWLGIHVRLKCVNIQSLSQVLVSVHHRILIPAWAECNVSMLGVYWIYPGRKKELVFEHFECKEAFCSKRLDAKQDFCSNILGLKQDFVQNFWVQSKTCSIILNSNQDFYSNFLGAK